MLGLINRVLVGVITASLLVAKGYTHKDVELLANIMYLENGSTGRNDDENRQILIMTGQVVINRTKQEGWGGDTIEKVLYSPGQYAKATKDRIGKVDIPDYVYELAKGLLAYGSNIPPYVVYQSTQKNLGYVWTVRAKEYFACAEKGHLYEGDDWVAEILGIDSVSSWVFPYAFGNSVRGGFISASVAYFRWNVCHFAITCLDVVNQQGRKVLYP